MVITFSTSNQEIKAACTSVDDDTLQIDALDLILFRGSKNVSKEAKKETYYPYIKSRNRIIKIWQKAE